jgi:anti-sigma B factor antagonist
MHGSGWSPRLEPIVKTDSRLLVQGIGDVSIVNFQDASILEAPLVQRIADELYSMADAQARRKIVLDFTNVRFLSSQTLGVMLTLQKKCQAIKGKVVLCGMRPDLLKMFKITGLEKMFEFYSDETKALDAF